jgi:hypothetical protein
MIERLSTNMFQKLSKGLKHLNDDEKDGITVAEKNRFETRAFAYLDIISWVESKVNQQPMGTIIYNKYQQSKRK